MNTTANETSTVKVPTMKNIKETQAVRFQATPELKAAIDKKYSNYAKPSDGLKADVYKMLNVPLPAEPTEVEIAEYEFKKAQARLDSLRKPTN